VTADLVDLARAGDGEAFRRLVGPYERELWVHCYRMLGSVQDAEDAMQDALLAAWQGIAGFEGRASVRTWLYRVTTTRCLNVRRSARRRPPAMPPGPVPPEPTRLGEVTWLEPCPDDLLAGLPDPGPGPEARYEAREAISLAFITAVQRLPPRQRAVLILRDVLGFAAGEVARILGGTEESVTSALKRARATLDRAAPQRHAPSARSAGSEAERELLDRLTHAFESNDVDSLVAMLTEDVLVSMPPVALEFVGLEPVTRFLKMVAFRPGRTRRVTPARANGQPALVVYVEESGIWRSLGILVFTLSGDMISAITHFDRSVLPSFGIPDQLG
jgi:RNA polymerase sigma-70 factor (ECF subfamily)